MKPQRRLDLIVPVFRNAELTSACIESIVENLDEIAHLEPRVIVIDDSPDDDAVRRVLESAEHRHAALTVLRNAWNLGFVASANRGFEKAVGDGRDVLLINSDTLTGRGTLAETVAVAGLDPTIGFVSPRSNNASICSLPHQPQFATLAPTEARRNWALLSATMPRFHLAPSAIGFYMFIRHEVLADLGGFDPVFGHGYEEENELVRRAARVGYQAALANHAFAYHHGAASFSQHGLDVAAQRSNNLATISAIHPDFVPLVQRYLQAPQTRAELLLSTLLPNQAGLFSLNFDLSGWERSHVQSHELTLELIRGLCERQRGIFEISVRCGQPDLAFHGLDGIPNLRRIDPESPEQHAIAVLPSAPVSAAQLRRFEHSAAITVHGVVEPMAPPNWDDLAAGSADALWRHVARHAGGFYFTNRHSEAGFRHRFDSKAEAYSRPLPGRRGPASDAPAARPHPDPDGHLVVIGNRSDVIARQLCGRLPERRIVCIGRVSVNAGQFRSIDAITIDCSDLADLIGAAQVVVLGSFDDADASELLRGISLRRPVVARRTAVTEEILASYPSVEGIHLFDSEREIPDLVTGALQDSHSNVDDRSTPGWDDWVAGFAQYCEGLLAGRNLFCNLLDRLHAADSPSLVDRAGTPSAAIAAGVPTLNRLLAHDGRAFIRMAYWTLLHRPPDPEGERGFLNALTTGTSKRDILRMIRTSPEGSVHAVSVPGLDLSEPLHDAAGQRLIVVLGMHRSGTSALTRGLQALGVELGDNLLPPLASENAKGYFEDSDITAFDVEMLASTGHDWHHLEQLDDSDVESLNRVGFFDRAVSLLQQKTAGKQLLGLKDPRISKLRKFWKPVFAHCALHTDYLVAIRNPMSVAMSLLARNGFEREKSYLMWLDYTLNSLLMGRGNIRAIVDYDVLLAAPEQTIDQLATGLGLPIERDALDVYLSEFLESDLRHARHTLEHLRSDPACPGLVCDLYEWLARPRSSADLSSQIFDQELTGWTDRLDPIQTTFRWIDRLAEGGTTPSSSAGAGTGLRRNRS